MIAATTISMLTLTTTTNNLSAQNSPTNGSNTAGNMTALVRPDCCRSRK
jgi:hypothetical protein